MININKELIDAWTYKGKDDLLFAKEVIRFIEKEINEKLKEVE